MSESHKKHCRALRGAADETDKETPKQATLRATRYVYHIHGHAKLHAYAPSESGNADQGPIVPFEVVIRRPFAIDSDEVMEEVRHEVRHHILDEMKRQDSPYLVGDVMIRGVSKLHRILVEADDTTGPAVRIMS